MDPPHRLVMSGDLVFAFTTCLSSRTEGAVQHAIDIISNRILPRYNHDAEGVDWHVRGSCVRVLLHVILAQLLLRRAVLQGVPFEGYQDMPQFIGSCAWEWCIQMFTTTNMYTVEGLMEDLTEASDQRGNRHSGGEVTLEAGPIMDVQRAMLSTSAFQIATQPASIAHSPYSAQFWLRSRHFSHATPGQGSSSYCYSTSNTSGACTSTEQRMAVGNIDSSQRSRDIWRWYEDSAKTSSCLG